MLNGEYNKLFFKTTGYAMIAARRVLAFLGLLLVSAAAFSQDAVIPAPKFDIQRFEVSGDTILGSARVQQLVTPFTGKQKDFGDVQRALEALEGAYRELGYGVIQVQLPEQDITRGVVRFNINQPKIGKVTVEGNQHFSTTNVRRSLPSIKEGETPNSNAIARNLQIAGEHPVKQSNVLLRSGASEGLVDVNVKVTDDRPWRLIATLDDSGTAETGYTRLGVGFQHTLFDRDHTLNLQYITSPSKLDKVAIYGFGYRIPYYRLNSSLDLYAGYSDVDSGTVNGLFSVTGSGTIFGGRWNYYLPKWRDVEHKVYLGLDYRAYKNNVSLGGIGGFVPDITTHPVSVGYGGLLRMAASEWAFNGSVSTNLPGGNDGTSTDFERSRTGATGNYTILRYGTSFSHAYRSEWQSRIAFTGQYTQNALVSGEQFGIGGPDSVRGYLPREASSDTGYATQIEVYTPNFAKAVGMGDKWRTRVVGFYDFGSVWRNNPLAAELHGKYLASTGLGLRLTYGKSVSLRVDLAQILKAHGTRQTDDQRLNASLVIIY